MSSTAGDFRNLTPLVLMSALHAGRHAGATSRCTGSSSRSRPTRSGRRCPVLARLRAVPQTPTMRGSPVRLEGEIPAARVHDLQQQLPALTRGEGVLESAFARYQPVRGRSRPGRGRTTTRSTARSTCCTSCGGSSAGGRRSPPGTGRLVEASQDHVESDGLGTGVALTFVVAAAAQALPTTRCGFALHEAGPDSDPLTMRTGAAGPLVECDSKVTGGFSDGLYDDGAVASDPAGAIEMAAHEAGFDGAGKRLRGRGAGGHPGVVRPTTWTARPSRRSSCTTAPPSMATAGTSSRGPAATWLSSRTDR